MARLRANIRSAEWLSAAFASFGATEARAALPSRAFYYRDRADVLRGRIRKWEYQLTHGLFDDDDG